MNKRTKALSISPRVKSLVWARQGGSSLWSGKPISINECCCHFVPRSKGGLGIEENIIGLTQEEHRIFDLNELGDNKKLHDLMRAKAREHLMKFYPAWDERRLVYRKYEK